MTSKLARFITLAHETIPFSHVDGYTVHAKDGVQRVDRYLKHYHELLNTLPGDHESMGEQTMQLLRALGWTYNPVAKWFAKVSRDGQMLAFLRNRRETLLGGLLDAAPRSDEPMWVGGFVYCVPFPADETLKRKAIESRLRMDLSLALDDAEREQMIDRYGLVYPGLVVAMIHASSDCMTEWWRNDAQRGTNDFLLFARVFEAMFDLVAMNDLFEHARSCLDDLSSPHWKWTTMPRKDLIQSLTQFAKRATGEAQIRKYILSDLGYPKEAGLRIWSRCLLHQVHEAGYTIELTDPDHPCAWLTINN